jgi:hypothetical protein
VLIYKNGDLRYLRQRDKSLSGSSPASWHDWLDLPKLRRLLPPIARVHVIFDSKLEDDTWQWLDLLRLEDVAS